VNVGKGTVVIQYWLHDIQHYDTWDNDTRHKGFMWLVTQHKWQHNNAMPSCWVSLYWVSRFYEYAECRYSECHYAVCCGTWVIISVVCYGRSVVLCRLSALTRCLLMKCHGSILFYYYFLAFFLVLMFKIKQFSTFQRCNIKLDHLSASKKCVLYKYNRF